MGLGFGSAWSTPRGRKLVALTLYALTMFLVVPLHQLDDDSPGIYGHLTEYPSHEGIAYDGGGRTEAQDDDNKPAGDKQPQSGNAYQENDNNKAEDKENGTLRKEAEGAGGPLEDDGKVEGDNKKHQGEPNKSGGSDGKPENEETAAEGAGSLIQEDKKPEGVLTSEGKGNTGSQNNDDDQTVTKYFGSQETISVVLETKPSEPVNVEIPSGPPSNLNSACDGFPNTDGILLVMKTGATEAYTKLPTHLLTSLQCLPNFLLFSDLEQQIGNYHVYNVLEDVKDEVKQGRKEFDLYKTQVDCPIPQQYCTADMKGGWELDKYKFIHMIDRVWAMRPNMEWYVFAEADSYVFWSNLVWWLRNKVNGQETPYVGSVTMLKNTRFAHGGSGYVIHGETVKKMAEIPDLVAKYDQMATHECCGDYLMSLAVMETGKKVRQAHPMFNGEKPVTLPFGNEHWCEPLLTMHHMNAEEVSSVWQYEKTREKKGPLQIKEIYEAFFGPNIKEKQDEWDNFSDDVCYIGVEPEAQNKASDHQKGRQKKEDQKNAVEQRAHHDEAHCAKVCEADGLGITNDEYFSLSNDEKRNALIKARYDLRKDDKAFHGSRRCFQWRYHKNVCCIARSFKNGKPKKEEKPGEKWTSGWFVQGINDWIAAKGDCEPKWKDLS
ncbi:uncharacterized protein BKA55DRAFT_572003 [Fusarium redolens]|uniref:Glycosyltransferase family 31 n=1 Tax=Fusarium redolens TaxID=48865 RepID=A0A9P9GZE4_FUSRE|nr:uncharacterized protein BKA55DRAFT_572003 [Fusarium redolens]KAH7247490.1 hypothetical protein BKA55DRAFT_572003 [Fusarium redolens]